MQQIYLVLDSMDFDGPDPYLVEMWLRPGAWTKFTMKKPMFFEIELGLPLGENLE